RERFDLDDDELEDKMFELAQKDYSLNNAPITLSLVEHPVVGVKGSRKERMRFLKNIVRQIVSLHSYDEVKIILIASKENMASLNEFRYLPHLWDDEKSIRFIANSTSDAYRISEQIKDEILDGVDRNRSLPEILANRPHYVVLSLDKAIFEGIEFLKEVMKKDECKGVSVISFFDNLPKECTALVDLTDLSKRRIVYLNDYERADDVFVADEVSEGYAALSTKLLSNTKLRNIAEQNSLPASATFLEMYNVGNIEQLAIAKNWKTNDPTSKLAVPVGISSDGTPFMLDLHEKFQGPHGLVAGTTGSGKSEFLLTYILSLAINFSPEEVSFVLIDYKGGGLASAFYDEEKGLHLPHVIGVITKS
ncbi:MAG: hypothetical protein HUJ65_07775, partial [Oscillospiraceae bacterium]|nr:hypothetical protein [Oscillospiraceae bacterium]